MKDWVQMDVRMGKGLVAKTYFVICSLLLPSHATFVHNNIFRFGIPNLGKWWVLNWGVGRVRGTLLKCRGKKR